MKPEQILKENILQHFLAPHGFAAVSGEDGTYRATISPHIEVVVDIRPRGGESKREWRFNVSAYVVWLDLYRLQAQSRQALRERNKDRLQGSSRTDQELKHSDEMDSRLSWKVVTAVDKNGPIRKYIMYPTPRNPDTSSLSGELSIKKDTDIEEMATFLGRQLEEYLASLRCLRSNQDCIAYLSRNPNNYYDAKTLGKYYLWTGDMQKFKEQSARMYAIDFDRSNSRHEYDLNGEEVSWPKPSFLQWLRWKSRIYLHKTSRQ